MLGYKHWNSSQQFIQFTLVQKELAVMTSSIKYPKSEEIVKIAGGYCYVLGTRC